MAEINKKESVRKYGILGGFALVFLIMGIILLPSINDFVTGYKVVLTHPSILDFDIFYHAGNMGVGFINSAMLIALSLLFYKLTKTDIQGIHIAALFMMSGAAFYGKNIVNILFPITGVIIHSLINKKKLSSVSAIALFSAAISPMFSVLAFGTESLKPGSTVAIIVAALVTISAGYLYAAVFAHSAKLHEGYLLFTAALAAGISGMFFNAFMKAFGIGHDAYPYGDQYSDHVDVKITITFGVLFLYLIIMGLIYGGKNNAKNILMHKGKGGNYVEQFGFASSLINMGTIGLFSLIYLDLTGGEINGPVLAALMTAVGFGAAGTNIKQHFPVLLGVAIMAFASGGVTGLIAGESFFAAGYAKLGARGMMLASMYCAGFAPITGEFGFLAGMFVGGMHAMLVPNIPPLHGWMSLYNNGFSMALVTIFLKPIYTKIGKKNKKIAE